ncbi:MAG: PhnD/SsuA/transferrin family substrate-binding protein [Gammaproteobacteria bacterium]
MRESHMRILDNWLYPLLNSLCLLAVFSMVLGHQPAVADSGKTALSAKKEYTMGVFPHLPPRQLEKVFAPMAKDLGNAINRHIILRTNTTYKKFAHNLDNEKFDIAFIQPFDYVTISHHRSHVSCMQQVLIGEADACGTAAPALRFFQHKMKVKLKVIAETDPIPHTLFAIHPRVPEYEREIIRERMVNWAKTRQGRKLLDTGKLSSFIPIENSAYDIVREFEKQSH